MDRDLGKEGSRLDTREPFERRLLFSRVVIGCFTTRRHVLINIGHVILRGQAEWAGTKRAARLGDSFLLQHAHSAKN